MPGSWEAGASELQSHGNQRSKDEEGLLSSLGSKEKQNKAQKNSLTQSAQGTQRIGKQKKVIARKLKAKGWAARKPGSKKAYWAHAKTLRRQVREVEETYIKLLLTTVQRLSFMAFHRASPGEIESATAFHGAGRDQKTEIRDHRLTEGKRSVQG
jgi:hypothetical protein